MSSLLDLAHEIVHDILSQVNPADLAALSKTCKAFNCYILGNRLLWKDVYLQNYDDPTRKPLQEEMRWEEELKKLVIFQKLLDSQDVTLKRNNIETVCSTALSLIETATPDLDTSLNTRLLTSLFTSIQNSDIFLFSSSLFAFAGDDDQVPASTASARQLSAKLHSYFGTSKEACGRTRSRAAHPWARSRVYDLRRYNEHNMWGPFSDEGDMQTDWEKVEAIMVVLGFNLQSFSERCSPSFSSVWMSPFEGVSPGSYTPMPRLGLVDSKRHDSGISLIEQPEPPLEAMDPYGVTGTWRRVVCFLDYNDLYHFNFGSEIPDDEPRPPISTQEAIRLITMKLSIKKIEPPGPEDGQDLPIVHFTGSSRSMHQSFDPNANSRLNGTVRLTPHGDIRWTTLSVFHGEARWRSESVQVGSIRSARGSVGTWFDKDYDESGPAGPTAFWKLTDYVERDPILDDAGEGELLSSLFS